MNEMKTWECVIVGGGAAGLSAALALGRARRRTLVVDAGEQSNLPAHGIGGLLGHDGRSPAELYEIGRGELGKYPSVEVKRGRVTAARGSDGAFEVELDDGSVERASKVLLAGGMSYEYDPLPGADGLWGDTVFHCPFCHGWEVEGRPLAARAKGDRAVHAGLLLRAWSDDVVVLTDGPAELDDEQRSKLEAAGVEVEERPIERVIAEDGKLHEIAFTDGARTARAGLLVAPRLRQRDPIAEGLGVENSPENPMMIDSIATDMIRRTNVPGVFAAGDQANPMPQITLAISTGAMAGAAVVQSLLADEFGLPMPPRG